jgi:demethylspheroidene O-methyltransferase
MLYQDLADPLALFRGELQQTELGRYWAYAGNADPAADRRRARWPTTAADDRLHGFVAEDTLDAYP